MPAPVPLKGKTIVITGASRGIGKAIGMRCAREGANVAILAKTAEPHPKLPGTIYTAAKDMEEIGGKALPLICDVRNEEQVKKAIDEVVKKFGGIDVLINNASALGLTSSQMTTMKSYDLMNQINARGTFLCSKYAIPHLEKSSNPHILMISPPLNMKPEYFGAHTGYTISKYGMSMAVLGLSDELRDKYIGVNALWPRTPVATAALNFIVGKSEHKGHQDLGLNCRTDEIMADAAYEIITSDSTTCTGNFFIDDELVKDKVPTLEKYSVRPGDHISYDFFVSDEDDKELMRLRSIKEKVERDLPQLEEQTRRMLLQSRL